MKTMLTAFAMLGIVHLSQTQLPPPFPRPGIQKALENEYVVVWKGLLGVKHVPTAMHYHERDLVGVFLDAGHVRARLQDGTARDGRPFIRGAVVFQPHGVTHTEEVLVDGTRAIGIELKTSTPTTSSSTSAITPDDGRVLVDNERVLVREYAWLPGVPVRQASHGVTTVLVGLESGEIGEPRPGGTAEPEAVVFGEVALTHGNLSRVTVATRGTPKVILVTVR